MAMRYKQKEFVSRKKSEVTLMKKNKLLLAALIPATALGVASCSNQSPSDSSTTETQESATFDSSFALTAEGVHRLVSEPIDDITCDIFNTLVSKGGSLIAGGITSYGTKVVLNILKECGFDFRDATTKTLEAIQEQLGQIEAKIKALAAQESRYHSEEILNPVLTTAREASHYNSSFVVNGLGLLATLENDPSKTEAEIEQERKKYYDDAISKLFINGKPFADYVTNFAESILQPNPADTSKDIFYYYTETLGVYDVWSTLKIRNMTNFMAYLDSTLVACADLAKYQMYYYTQGMGSAAIAAYESMVNDMADAVNKVNLMFKNAYEALKPLQDKKDKGIITYMSSGKDYSSRMATLTYNLDDKEGDDSRQALIRDFHEYSDGSRGKLLRFALQYVPDQTFVAKVAEDFRTYSQAFYTPDYTLQDYLKYVGFYAVNQDLFDNSLGLYDANMYSDGHGFLNEDYDYSSAYFNKSGEYTRSTVYKVDSYHNWNCNVVRTTLDNCGKGYYLCFATPDGDKQKLDGTYSTVYMKDEFYTVQEAAFYDEYLDDAYKTNKTGWYLHDCW